MSPKKTMNHRPRYCFDSHVLFYLYRSVSVWHSVNASCARVYVNQNSYGVSLSGIKHTEYDKRYNYLLKEKKSWIAVTLDQMIKLYKKEGLDCTIAVSKLKEIVRNNAY